MSLLLSLAEASGAVAPAGVEGMARMELELR